MPRFVEVPEFEKDLGRLKFDIDEDLERFKKALAVDKENLIGSVRISNLGEGICPVFKARKFRCKALQKGSKSGIRVIYFFNHEKEEIHLIEIYSKGKKENHDLDRIKKYATKNN